MMKIAVLRIDLGGAMSAPFAVRVLRSLPTAPLTFRSELLANFTVQVHCVRLIGTGFGNRPLVGFAHLSC